MKTHKHELINEKKESSYRMAGPVLYFAFTHFKLIKNCACKETLPYPLGKQNGFRCQAVMVAIVNMESTYFFIGIIIV